MMGDELQQQILAAVLAIRGSVERTVEWQMQHEIQDTERHTELLGHIKGHSLRISKLEDDTDELEKTGRHELHVQADLWRGLFLKVAGAVMLVLFTAVVTWLFSRGK